jgi:hypothetical protein
VTTRLSSVKELTDDSDGPTDDSDDQITSVVTEVTTLAKINCQKQDFCVSCLSCCPVMSTFFLNFDRKITGLGIWKRFGTDLVIPNIWLFGRLGEKTNYFRHPLGATG